ncbi:acyl-CoA dehydrogenase family protein [Mycobacterium sp. 050272]|uniref:acyl-CoA dehydrogenase family protein n=1 Tax=Mycobacterium sp. 050272 TaxID=3142488 RepID=UPI003190AE92
MAGIRTTATRDGDDWIFNGSKTFISAGVNSDLVIVVARADPDAGHQGFLLLLIERGMVCVGDMLVDCAWRPVWRKALGSRGAPVILGAVTLLTDWRYRSVSAGLDGRALVYRWRAG